MTDEMGVGDGNPLVAWYGLVSSGRLESKMRVTPLRIRILAGSLNQKAGSHRYNRELAIRLADRGHSVSVLAFDHSEDVAARASLSVVPRQGFEKYRAVWRFAARLESIRFGLLISRMRLEPLDVVIAAEHLFLRPHARRFSSVPWIYLPHSLRVRDEIEGYRLPVTMGGSTIALYEGLQRWALAHSTVTLRFTRKACTVLQSEYSEAAGTRFIVNPPGVDAAERCPHRRPMPRDIRLLYVGQLVPHKRVDMILSALGELRDGCWRLDIVGDGPQRGLLEELARQLGIASRVRFLGHQADPAPWYRAADLLLLTSRSESYALVLIEAMAAGTPCLALKSDGVSTWNANEEIIEHGVTGLLADGEAGFRRELRAVLFAPQRLESLGRAAWEHVSRDLTWEAHLGRYEGLFAELLAARRVRGD